MTPKPNVIAMKAPATDLTGETRDWKFSEIISEPAVRERWHRVRQYFFLRESTYDMTTQCNIHCEGCYYYEGEKQHAVDNRDPSAWRGLMRSEKDRGITFVVLAGAEPSLVPEICAVCYEEIPLGAIATNGLRKIPTDIGYKIHISVWGNDAASLRVRGARDMLRRQIDNYRDDPRAVFVYTFTRDNIDQADEVTKALSAVGAKVTFNVFSAPVGYGGPLRHDPGSLEAIRRTTNDLLDRYPDNVLFSPYNIVAHTQKSSLHDLFGCSYPRQNPSTDIGLGRSFRQYRSDLSWDRAAACCVPDTDCDDCRHYAAGSAIVTARLFRHAIAPLPFKAWLDYVDTYLAVWVSGYDKGANLCNQAVSPPRYSKE